MPEGIVPGSRECTSHINLSRAMEYGAVGCPVSVCISQELGCDLAIRNRQLADILKLCTGGT